MQNVSLLLSVLGWLWLALFFAWVEPLRPMSHTRSPDAAARRAERAFNRGYSGKPPPLNVEPFSPPLGGVDALQTSIGHLHEEMQKLRDLVLSLLQRSDADHRLSNLKSDRDTNVACSCQFLPAVLTQSEAKQVEQFISDLISRRSRVAIVPSPPSMTESKVTGGVSDESPIIQSANIASKSSFPDLPPFPVASSIKDSPAAFNIATPRSIANVVGPEIALDDRNHAICNFPPDVTSVIPPPCDSGSMTDELPSDPGSPGIVLPDTSILATWDVGEFDVPTTPRRSIPIITPSRPSPRSWSPSLSGSLAKPSCLLDGDGSAIGSGAWTEIAPFPTFNHAEGQCPVVEPVAGEKVVGGVGEVDSELRRPDENAEVATSIPDNADLQSPTGGLMDAKRQILENLTHEYCTKLHHSLVSMIPAVDTIIQKSLAKNIVPKDLFREIVALKVRFARSSEHGVSFEINECEAIQTELKGLIAKIPNAMDSPCVLQDMVSDGSFERFSDISTSAPIGAHTAGDLPSKAQTQLSSSRNRELARASTCTVHSTKSQQNLKDFDVVECEGTQNVNHTVVDLHGKERTQFSLSRNRQLVRTNIV